MMDVSINKKIILLCIFIFFSCNQFSFIDSSNKINKEDVNKISPSINNNIPPTELHKDFNLSLWANDSLAMDPIAISIDQSTGNIYYTRGKRITHSEFDIRSHPNWMTKSISWETIEDRKKFLRKNFAFENKEAKKFLKDLNKDGILDWKDLTVEKEQIWVVSDSNSDGIADKSSLYIEDFNEEISDLANGVEFYDGEVFISVAPDMWRTKDTNLDGKADFKESLSRGYGVHIGFGAHGMSGAKIGPDGRIWWSIGDIGMNVIDKDNYRWKYPNQGVIVRSELDGTGFEVYSSGLRNTHEFDFDKFGNLIAIDNDADHDGERERLVHLINGSDGGWRINWQFGKYTDSKNNSYKVWIDEKMHIPHWDGQAAYFLPPIINYINGPTGLAYNPGSALSDKWKDHFFVSEFRGSPTSSPIHAFKLEQNGSSFKLEKTQEIIKGLLPTGIDFGPDGAMYFGDWDIGWNTNKKGRIWKIDTIEKNNKRRNIVSKTLKQDFKKLSLDSLNILLSNEDLRVRQKSQFQSVKRGSLGLEIFLKRLTDKSSQIARIHSIWGIGQLSRKNIDILEKIIIYLKDEDEEVINQTIKIIGDSKYQIESNYLIPFLKHKSLRVQLHTLEAMGRIKSENTLDSIIENLRINNNQDLLLRHAGIIALSRIATSEELEEYTSDKSDAVRLACVVALRRMQSPLIEVFLKDKNEFIVTEAARGINDDYSIKTSLPALANLINYSNFSNEPLVRRSLNANLRVGKIKNIQNLINFSMIKINNELMRSEAINILSNWKSPSLHDRVDGRYRGEINRNDEIIVDLFSEKLIKLINDDSKLVRISSIKALSILKINIANEILLSFLKNDQSSDIRKQSLITLLENNSYKSKNIVFEIASNDSSELVRTELLKYISLTDISKDQKTNFLINIYKKGTIKEKQESINQLKFIENDKSKIFFKNLLDGLIAESIIPEIRLEIYESLKYFKDYKIKYNNAFKDTLTPYYYTISGGDKEKGKDIFLNNISAQCTRCHAIGGNNKNLVGPNLENLSRRLSPKEIVESLILPSKQISPGYGISTFDLDDMTEIHGKVIETNNYNTYVDIGNGEIIPILNSKIVNKINHMSNMPSIINILSLREIRDLVSTLSSLK